VLAGASDPVTTTDDAWFIADRVPRARCGVLRASHLANIEAADAFNAAVLDFFRI
jgi:3-oxoadipate enol-lactonase